MADGLQTNDGAPSPSVTLFPVVLARHIADRVAVLAFVDAALAAVLVRLDDEAHEELRSHWVIEADFGRCDLAPPPIFATLDEVKAWLSTVWCAHPGPEVQADPLPPSR